MHEESRINRAPGARADLILRHAAIVVAALGLIVALGACRTTDGPTPEPTADAGPAAKEGSEVVPETAAREHTETDLITNVRQLILAGERSGEGYFSPDGRRMIYQAEREPDNPFYQIYILDLETGDTQRVSPGPGKTTCAWFHPDGEKVLFASTHEDPNARALMQERLDERASGEESRYSFEYDDTYEIYEMAIGGSDLVNLTNTPGYDAEGSWSPDGRHIVFASNRLAYGAPMSEEDQKWFDLDPAYMSDIYIMDADGSNVLRLTEEPGYDGGPFFSPDGERITWRHFNEEGTLAEIWTMAVDGSDKRQLTRIEAMSWAPFYHPSGDYIIFTTNVHGFQNFELYMVDVAGEKEPVRVTFTDGADVLPVFTPAGDRLAWVTRRGGDGKAQITIADWNDAKARELLALAPERGQVSYAVEGGEMAVADMAATAPEIRPEDARLHVEQLASDAMEGRMTGTPGEAMATDYVAGVFEALGLEPAGDDGYFQPFAFTSGVSLVEPNVLSITTADGEELEPAVDVDWRPLSFGKPGSVGFADVVFAGYGIVAPELDGEAAYDSYGELEVEGKWVVALRYLPEGVTPERRQHLSRYASLRFKAMEARDRNAQGLVIVSGPASQVQDDLVPLRFDGSIAGTSVTALSMTDELAETLFAGTETDLAAAQAALDGGEELPGFELPGYQMGAHISLELDESTGRNTLGRLVVGDAPSAEIVVIGAHVDHLGHGETGDSLARADEQGQVHHGADDNASGVAGLLEIAQLLAEQKAAGELDGVRRDVLFAAWSGEELGLLGSSHFVKAYGGGDLETLYPEISAYLNMDMIGRMEDEVILQAVASSPWWAIEIEKRNVAVGLPLTLSEDTYLPTDATSFYLKGVPILSAFTGAHSEYNTPRDTADTLNYEGLAKTARLMGLVARSAAALDEAPEYVKTAPSTAGSTRRSQRVYLGTIPDYTAMGGDPDESTGGVLLSDVAPNGPAEAAGILGGDVLVEMAGQTLENIYDYMRVLDALKIGEPVDVVVERDGERLTLEITPVSRE